MKKEEKTSLIIAGVLCLCIIGLIAMYLNYDYNKAVEQCIKSGHDSIYCQEGLR